MTGLLYPSAFSGAGASTSAQKLWELPDTSIAFRRCLNSGRLINVQDWYESFAVVLDEQRRQVVQPNKRRKGKGAKNIKENPEDEEQWQMEQQARFLRAVHELDYLGFIKHTNRRAGHVMRTVYDVVD
jgi:origin recognition complex subunit 3